jgi:hypothetical protein
LRLQEIEDKKYADWLERKNLSDKDKKELVCLAFIFVSIKEFI